MWEWCGGRTGGSEWVGDATGGAAGAVPPKADLVKVSESDYTAIFKGITESDRFRGRGGEEGEAGVGGKREGKRGSRRATPSRIAAKDLRMNVAL